MSPWSLYPARSHHIVGPPYRGRQRLYDFRTDSEVPLPLRFCLVRTYDKFEKKGKPIANRHVVRALCGGGTLFLWKMQDFRLSFGKKNCMVIVGS